MPASTRNRLLCALLGVAAAVALIAHMLRFRFVTDDAFISFVYSRNLVEHGQLVFNLGERVEGYTNFLWTVFLAGWLKLGWQPESSSIVWGTTFAIASFLPCARLVRWARGGTEYVPWDALPALLLATLSGYACWSGGGLETQMFTFFVTLAAALYLTRERGPGLALGLVFGLAALTRPEGNLFFALTALHHAIGKVRAREWRVSRGEVAFVAAFLALVVPHLVWRHAYYGWWVPNTFYIKSSGGFGAWGRGLYYLTRASSAHLLLPLAVVSLGAFLDDQSARRLLGYTLLCGAVFALYVVSVGGDFMGLFRFTLPIVPLIVVAGVVGFRAILVRARKDWLAPIAAALVLGIFVWNAIAVDKTALAIGSDNGIDTPGYLRWYTADRAAIGKWFGAHRQDDDFAAVGGAGAQVYYSRMRSLDCFGLSDEYIAHSVPPVSNRPGHQKYAPDDYILSRKPTIITSHNYNIGDAPLVRPDEGFWRSHGYHYVAVEVPGLSSRWYSFLKRMDRSVGPLPAVNGEID